MMAARRLRFLVRGLESCCSTNYVRVRHLLLSSQDNLLDSSDNLYCFVLVNVCEVLERQSTGLWVLKYWVYYLKLI